MQKTLLAVAMNQLATLSVILLPGIGAACGGPLHQDRAREDAPPDAGLTFSSRISHPLLLAGEEQELYLHVALASAEVPNVPRPGLNLALVIDRSGSMASQDKLRFAKSAAEQAVGRLRPDDRLAIVTYDDEIRTDVPSTLANERDVFLPVLRALEPGGSTDLHGGLVRGCEEVRAHLDAERLNAVLLISDGLANTGVIDPRAIAECAAGFRRDGLRISTMGLGLDYDERLLLGIAQEAGGSYYYVNAAESVGRFLDQELDELSRITARDMELRLDLADGVEVRQVFGYARRVEGRSVTVPLRDMYSGQRRKVVLRLGVRGSVGEHRSLADVSLRYLDALTHESHRVRATPPDVAFTGSMEAVQEACDRDVLVQAEVVQNADALDTAMKLQKEGRFREAQELLAARYLNSSTRNAAELRSAEVERVLQRMQQVMQDIERTRSDPRARRDLQLMTELQALAYAGDG